MSTRRQHRRTPNQKTSRAGFQGKASTAVNTLKPAMVNVYLRLVFIDPEGKAVPFPKGFPVEVEVTLDKAEWRRHSEQTVANDGRLSFELNPRNKEGRKKTFSRALNKFRLRFGRTGREFVVCPAQGETTPRLEVLDEGAARKAVPAFTYGDGTDPSLPAHLRRPRRAAALPLKPDWTLAHSGWKQPTAEPTYLATENAFQVVIDNYRTEVGARYEPVQLEFTPKWPKPVEVHLKFGFKEPPAPAQPPSSGPSSSQPPQPPAVRPFPEKFPLRPEIKTASGTWEEAPEDLLLQPDGVVRFKLNPLRIPASTDKAAHWTFERFRLRINHPEERFLEIEPRGEPAVPGRISEAGEKIENKLPRWTEDRRPRIFRMPERAKWRIADDKVWEVRDDAKPSVDKTPPDEFEFKPIVADAEADVGSQAKPVHLVLTPDWSRSVEVHLKLQWLDPEGKAASSPSAPRPFPKDFRARPVLEKADGTAVTDGEGPGFPVTDDAGNWRFVVNFLPLPRKDDEKPDFDRLWLKFDWHEPRYMVCEAFGGSKSQKIEDVKKTEELLATDTPPQVFRLPKEWNTFLSDWEAKSFDRYLADDAPDEVKNKKRFKVAGDKDYYDVGEAGSPVEFTLNPHWQFSRFEFFDRYYGHDSHSHKPVAVPPLRLKGHLARPDSSEVPPDTDSNWRLHPGEAKNRVQCLPWILRLEVKDSKHRPVKRPNKECVISFKPHATKLAFIHSTGSGDGDRKLVYLDPAALEGKKDDAKKAASDAETKRIEDQGRKAGEDAKRKEIEDAAEAAELVKIRKEAEDAEEQLVRSEADTQARKTLTEESAITGKVEEAVTEAKKEGGRIKTAGDKAVAQPLDSVSAKRVSDARTAASTTGTGPTDIKDAGDAKALEAKNGASGPTGAIAKAGTDAEADWEKLKPCADRLKYYDLPQIWKSPGWWCRLSDSADEQGFFEDLARKDTTAAKPLIFCLDDIVLAKPAAKDFLPLATVRSDRAILFYHEFKKPASGDGGRAGSTYTKAGIYNPTPARDQAITKAKAAAKADALDGFKVSDRLLAENSARTSGKTDDEIHKDGDDAAAAAEGNHTGELNTAETEGETEEKTSDYPYSLVRRRGADRNYFAEYPHWTRLVVCQGNLFDVFDRRVNQDEATHGADTRAVGARAAARWVNAVDTADCGVGAGAGSAVARPDLLPDPPPRAFISQPFYQEVTFARDHSRAGTATYNEWSSPIAAGDGTLDRTGRFDVAHLRCCSRDGDDEIAVAFRYHRYDFSFKTRPNALDDATVAAPQREAKRDAWMRTFVDKCAKRWTGDEEAADVHPSNSAFVNGDRTWVVQKTGTPKIKSQVITLVQKLPAARAHFLIHTVAETKRSYMSDGVGDGELRGKAGDDSSGRGFAGAHETGHAGGHPDEYCDTEDGGVLGFGSNNIPGTPFDLDDDAMMNGARALRARTFWQTAEWIRTLPGLSAVDFKVEHGAESYELPHYPHDDRKGRHFATFPIAANLRHKPADPVLYDTYLYTLGADEFSTSVLPGLCSTGGPVDGILVVMIKARFDFKRYTDVEQIRKKVFRACNQKVANALNKKVFADFTLPGSGRRFSKCLLHFSIRFSDGRSPSTPHLMVEIKAPADAIPAATPAIAAVPGANYYWWDGTAAQGPLSQQQLFDLVAAGTVTAGTQVVIPPSPPAAWAAASTYAALGSAGYWYHNGSWQGPKTLREMYDLAENRTIKWDTRMFGPGATAEYKAGSLADLHPVIRRWGYKDGAWRVPVAEIEIHSKFNAGTVKRDTLVRARPADVEQQAKDWPEFESMFYGGDDPRGFDFRFPPKPANLNELDPVYEHLADDFFTIVCRLLKLSRRSTDGNYYQTADAYRPIVNAAALSDVGPTMTRL